MEDWHRKFNTKVKVAHPTINKFIRHIQDVERLIEIRILEVEKGHCEIAMPRKYTDLDRPLVLLNSELDNSQILLNACIAAIPNQKTDPPII